MATPAKQCKTAEEPDPTFLHPETARDLTKKLFKSQKSCDVFFVVGPERERIGAHKLILGGRSPVFEVLFSDRRAESAGQEENEIVLEQEEPATIHLFLEYVYADTFSGNAVEAIKLLHLAQFYDVQPLIKLCEKVLAKPFPVDDVLQIFTTAQKYALPEVVTHAAETMANHFSRFSESPTFDKADEATLVYLLEREDLVYEEHKLFSAILQWGDKQIKNSTLDPKPSRKEVLKNLFPLIRFLTMTAKEFAAAVVPTNALAPQTALKLLAYINLDEEQRNSLSSSISYGKTRQTPRQCAPFQIDFYQPSPRPGTGNYIATVLRKSKFVRDKLTFTFCESSEIRKKDLRTRIVSLVLKAPRFDEPAFGNSSEVAANMDFPIRVGISLGLHTTNKDGVMQLVRVGEEVFAKIGQESMELTLDRPWELSSNKAHTIVLRLISEVYTVPNVVNDGSYARSNRNPKFDYFTATTIQDNVSHGSNCFGTVTLSNLSFSGDIGSGPVPSASEGPNSCSSVNTFVTSGLHLLRSVKLAFA